MLIQRWPASLKGDQGEGSPDGFEGFIFFVLLSHQSPEPTTRFPEPVTHKPYIPFSARSGPFLVVMSDGRDALGPSALASLFLRS